MIVQTSSSHDKKAALSFCSRATDILVLLMRISIQYGRQVHTKSPFNESSSFFSNSILAFFLWLLSPATVCNSATLNWGVRHRHGCFDTHSPCPTALVKIKIKWKNSSFLGLHGAYNLRIFI